jgi:hypothetical protein
MAHPQVADREVAQHVLGEGAKSKGPSSNIEVRLRLNKSSPYKQHIMEYCTDPRSLANYVNEGVGVNWTYLHRVMNSVTKLEVQ